jgi:EmrB/QacA subfamily drug resistance transporter
MAVTQDGQLLRLKSAPGRWTLAAMVLGSGVVMLDATVVSVALPRIAQDLNADFAGLQWVVNGYTLTLAALILTAGSLGDRYGRRKMFSVGVTWFAIASAACALAPNVTLLTLARALQGVGGALLTPGSLAIISAVFHPDDRAKAIGAWSGLGGVTAAVGPFVGGWLVLLSWRWIFLVNLPLAAAVLAITARHVPESRDPTAPSQLDLTGMALGALGLAATTYALIQRSWVVGLAGLLVLVAFIVVEQRSRHPMLPVGIFGNSVFRSTNLLTFVVYGALSMNFFMVPLVLQIAMGYSPLAAGGALFPVTALLLVLSARAGALAQRIGARIPLTFGPLLIALGFVLFGRLRPGAGYLTAVLPAAIVFGLGLALMVAPLTATVLASADDRHAGIASGVNNAVARAAGLIGVAALPLLAGFDPNSQVGPDTLVAGFQRASYVAAALCVVGAGLAWFTLTGPAAARTPVVAAPPVAAPPVAPPPPSEHIPAAAAASGQAPGDSRPYYHCGVGAPPLVAKRGDRVG